MNVKNEYNGRIVTIETEYQRQIDMFLIQATEIINRTIMPVYKHWIDNIKMQRSSFSLNVTYIVSISSETSQQNILPVEVSGFTDQYDHLRVIGAKVVEECKRLVKLSEG